MMGYARVRVDSLLLLQSLGLPLEAEIVAASYELQAGRYGHVLLTVCHPDLPDVETMPDAEPHLKREGDGTIRMIDWGIVKNAQ